MNMDCRFEREIWYYKAKFENLKFNYCSGNNIDQDNLEGFDLKRCKAMMFLNDSFIIEHSDFNRDKKLMNLIYLAHEQDPTRTKIVQVNKSENPEFVRKICNYHPNTIAYSPLMFKIKILVSSIFHEGANTILQNIMMTNFMLFPTEATMNFQADWFREHSRSIRQEIYFLPFDKFFYGKKFSEAVKMVYNSKNKKGYCGPLLLGVVQIDKNNNKKTLHINPVNLEIDECYKGIVLAENENIAKMITKFTENYFYNVAANVVGIAANLMANDSKEKEDDDERLLDKQILGDLSREVAASYKNIRNNKFPK